MKKLKSTMKKIISLFAVKKIEKVNIPVLSSEMLQDRAALIVGGAGGVGLGITKQFLASSCKVVISGTNEDKLKRIVKDLDTDKVSYVILDTKNVSSIKASIWMQRKKWGKGFLSLYIVRVFTVIKSLEMLLKKSGITC